MPPVNRLAPPPVNAFVGPYGPVTSDPEASAAYQRQLVSGLGSGLTNQLRGMYGTARHIATSRPIDDIRAGIGALVKLYKDPAIAMQVLRDLRQRAAAGPKSLGELLGEMVPLPGPKNTLRRGPMQELDVYHGTPHQFPGTEKNPLGEFEASKIGTGEGAQAYGRGVYLAESPKVARGYATHIPYRNFEKKVSQVYSEFDSPDDAMEALKEAGLSAQELRVVQALQNDDFLGFDYPHQALRAALKEPEYYDLSPETKSAIQNLSSLYKADLPDEMIDRMLDYDKPFNQQSPNVQKAIKDALEVRKRQTGGYGLFDPLEKSSIKDLVGSIGEERLRQAGIPGIRYLDAGSRGNKGDGTRNFVVFPGEEKKVRILERK